MEKIYEELNQHLREYIQDAEQTDLFFLVNIPVFYELVKNIDINDITLTDIEVLDECEGNNTLEFTKDFLCYLNPKYKKIFNNAFDNGIIDFYDEEDVDNNIEFNTIKIEYYDEEKRTQLQDEFKDVDLSAYSFKKEYIKCLMNYSLRDSQRFIHEIMHHINYPIDDLSSTGRKTFSETISIIAETFYLEWLEKETDVSKEMLNEYKKARIFDTISCIECLREQLPIIQTSLNLDKVDYENYKYYMMIDNEDYLTKEEYDENCNNFSEDIKSNNAVHTSIYVHYLLGTSITSYLINNKNHKKRIKEIINYLNDNINEMNEYMVFEKLGMLPLENINDSLSKILQKTLNKYKNN